MVAMIAYLKKGWGNREDEGWGNTLLDIEDENIVFQWGGVGY